MIQLDKAVRDDYWWTKQGTVLVDAEAVESIEQMYDRAPGGNSNAAYTLITMRTGTQHKIMGDVSSVGSKLGLHRQSD